MNTSTRWILLSLILAPIVVSAQIDPVKRDLIQFGYNAPLEGRPPLSAYAFYYRNQPDFLRTNLTLRLALAPTYLDSELGIRSALGEYTDLGIGLAGGGFADSYDEIKGGTFLPEQSFTGHGGEASISVYHLFNPDRQIPLNGVLRSSVHYSTYQKDEQTAANFSLPNAQIACSVRAGLRWGGKEPTLYPSLAMELSVWYEGQFRTDAETYGYGDRRFEPHSHLFWAEALLAYTFPKSEQNLYLNLTAGTSVDADRFSAYRLGELLPFTSEFPLSLPGYYYQEISARQFVLLGGNYILPLDKRHRWNFDLTIATAFVDYLPGLDQPGNRLSGVGGGILYKTSSFKVMAGYAYGVDAIRKNERGANSVGVLMQLDLERARTAVLNPEQPGRWRGWQRILGVFSD